MLKSTEPPAALASPPPVDATREIRRRLARSLLESHGPLDFTIRFWDGFAIVPEDGGPSRFTLVLNSPEALRTLVGRNDPAALGRAFVDKLIDVEGPITEAFPLADHLTRPRSRWESLRNRLWLALSLPRTAGPPGDQGWSAAQLKGRRASRARTREAIHYHYELPVEFWNLWLDRDLQYTCAYFEDPDEDIDTAQTRKLDYVCKKLHLTDSTRLMEFGCGWGGLLAHAAKRHGARGKGVTLSPTQASHAQGLFHREGVDALCAVEVRDIRDLREDGAYDRAVGVGVMEHIGEAMLASYFSQAWRLLRPGGLFLNQAIARAWSAKFPRKGSFIDQYVFPDTRLLPLSTTLKAAEVAGFEVRDVENLREHYVLTLSRWLDRLDAARDEIKQLTSEATYRTFRIYLAGSLHGFDRGRLQLNQILLAKPDRGRAGMPLTRSSWYA